MSRLNGMIIMTSACPRDSMLSSVKIARYLEKRYKLPLYCWKDHGELLNVDYAFVVNASTTFTEEPYRRFISAQMGKVKKAMVFCQNDYLLVPHSTWMKPPLTRRGVPIVWWTISTRRVKTPLDRLIDWNRLAWDPHPLDGPAVYAKRERALLYYGSFRPNRAAIFEKYFGGPARVKRVIQTPTRKSAERFKAIAHPSVEITIDKSPAIDKLRRYALTLYIQDPYSSRNAEALANRFYEAVSAGTAIAVDRASIGTFQRAGLDASEYVVDGPTDSALQNMMHHTVARWQRVKWGADYHDILKREVDGAYRALIKGT